MNNRFDIYQNCWAGDYYFYVAMTDDEDEMVFWIINKQFWEQYHCVDDCHIARFIEKFLPSGFCEIQESCFEFDGVWTDGIVALENAGFVKLTDNH